MYDTASEYEPLCGVFLWAISVKGFLALSLGWLLPVPFLYLVQMFEYAEKIIASMTDSILEEPLATIDYIEIVDLVSMKKVEKVESPVLVAMAIFFGETRLIDNFIFQ